LHDFVNIIDEFLSFDEFKFVKNVGHWCNMSAVLQICWTFYGFLIHNVERYSCYFILFELLFDFLSNDEFKFVRIVGRMINPYMMMGLQHGVMPPPCGGHGRPFGPRGDLFWGGCARFARPFMLYQFNAIQRVLVRHE
jgi:hypothetical protein